MKCWKKNLYVSWDSNLRSPELRSGFLPLSHWSVGTSTESNIPPIHIFNLSRAHFPTFPSLELHHNSLSNPSVALPTSQLIPQPFRCFTYVTAYSLLILQRFRHFTYVTIHSPTLPSLYLRHNSFSNPSVALPTSPLILQPFRCFTYVTAHSLLILQPFRHFTYATTHSPTIPSLYLRHSSFSKPSVASPTSQFILQLFFRFSYVRSSSLNSPGEPPMAGVT